MFPGPLVVLFRFASTVISVDVAPAAGARGEFGLSMVAVATKH